MPKARKSILNDGKKGASQPLQSTDGDDLLVGSNRTDSIDGGLGNDVIRGKGGNDQLLGNLGNDLLSGDQKNDSLDGGEGDDQMLGGAGNDVLIAGFGNDTLLGGTGKDKLWGNDGNDLLNGGQSKDVLYGGAGSDILLGGNGNDLIVGADALIAPTAPTDPTLAPTPVVEVDILVGGTGKDTFVLGLAGNVGLYTAGGAGDYAVISDFKQPDTIQLSGSALNYTLQTYTGTDGTTGTGIYLGQAAGVQPELVAVLSGVQTTNVNLSSSSFTYTV